MPAPFSFYGEACPVSTEDIADRCMEVIVRAIAGTGYSLHGSAYDDLYYQIADYLIEAPIANNDIDYSK